MFDLMKCMFMKEVGSYFKTGAFYFAFVIYLILSMLAAFFLMMFFDVNNQELSSFFYYQPTILVFVIPALTMRLWVDEKKSGTLEFLLTQPISYKIVVLTKFLAAFSLGVLMLLATFPLWFYASLYINMDNMSILSSYIGCILIMGMFCALGCVVSVMCNNAITAYLLGVFVCGVFSFLKLAPLESLSFARNYQDFFSGQVGVDSLMYFLSIIFFSLWFNLAVVENSNEK